MSDNSNGSSSGGKAGGLGFVSALTLIFIVLKLVGVITWSWLWVLSPIWISAALVLLIIIIYVIIIYVIIINIIRRL